MIEPPDPETPDGSPAETTVIGTEPESETTILPEEVLEDVADPDSPSGDSKAMTWVKRGLIIAGAAIVLLIIPRPGGLPLDGRQGETAYERAQASMSQLAACNGKAKNTVGDADKAGVDDKDVDTLRDLVASNGKLIRSKRAGLSISESERLSTKADKATKRTAHWPARSTGSVKAKPLMDARRKCRDALDKAVKASTDAKPSDDATRAAKATLDKLIGQARKARCENHRRHVERHGIQARQGAREPLPGVGRESQSRRGSQTAGRSAGASPTASPANSNSRRCPRRRRSTAALPAQAPPACRKATAEEPQQQQWRNIQRQLWRMVRPPETNDNSLPSNDSSL